MLDPNATKQLKLILGGSLGGVLPFVLSCITAETSNNLKYTGHAAVIIICG
jgi:hypothetical protein